MFSDRAKRRQDLALKLRAEVRRHGAEPEDNGTALAKAHRAFLEIKDQVMGQILARQSNLESAAKKLIDTANANGGLDNVTAILVRFNP